MTIKIEFTDEPFMSAKVKRQLHKEMWQFLSSGLVWERFTKRVYEFFHIRLGFLHWGGREQFYQTCLSNDESKEEFLLEAIGATSEKITMGNGDYADILHSMYAMFSEFGDQFEVEGRMGDDRAEKLAKFRSLANELGFLITDDQMQDLHDQLVKEA